MGALPACVSVPHICAWYFSWPEEGIRSPGSGVADSCSGCWELNLGPLQAQCCHLAQWVYSVLFALQVEG